MTQQEQQVIRDLKLLINGLVMLLDNLPKSRILISILNLIIQQLIALDSSTKSLQRDYLQTRDFLSEDISDVDDRGFKYEKRIEALEKELEELKLTLSAFIKEEFQ